MKPTPKFHFLVMGIFALALACCIDSTVNGQATVDQQTTDSAKQISQDAKPNVDSKLIAKFRDGLTNTKFVGQFTITGMEDQTPRQEEYTITQVKKMEKGDWWEITARIKYGDHDLTVPMPMEVKWADQTPVITVNRLFIPGLGTFDARVLLRKDKYAGTWAHDDVGGHLFGKIIKLEENEANDKATESAKKNEKSGTPK